MTRSELKELSKEDAKHFTLGAWKVLTSDKISFIVLFDGPDSRRGTVIYSDNLHYGIGYHGSDWGRNEFVPYKGQVIITSD